MEKYSRNSRVISGRLEDALVMMDIDQGKYFSLDPVATRIWDLLEDPPDIEELVMILTNEYEVDPDKCRSDVRELLEEMMRLGLVFVQ